MDKSVSSWYKSQTHSFKAKCISKYKNTSYEFKFIYEFFEHLQERRYGMATIKSSSESDQTSTVNCEDEK